jgi:hypothetical protein
VHRWARAPHDHDMKRRGALAGPPVLRPRRMIAPIPFGALL